MKYKCQRCGQTVTEEERRASGRFADWTNGVCSQCISHLPTGKPNEIKSPKKPKSGWWIFKSISDYQYVFDQVRVCYNNMELPDSFPCAARLHVADYADHIGAWFTYLYLPEAQSLIQAHKEVHKNASFMSLGD